MRTIDAGGSRFLQSDGWMDGWMEREALELRVLYTAEHGLDRDYADAGKYRQIRD
jgi:hypothetical protein